MAKASTPNNLDDFCGTEDVFGFTACTGAGGHSRWPCGPSLLKAMSETIRGIRCGVDRGIPVPASLMLSSEAIAVIEETGVDANYPVNRRSSLCGVPVFLNDDMFKMSRIKSKTPFCEFDDGDDWAVWAGMAERVPEKVHAIAVNIRMDQIGRNVFADIMGGRDLEVRA